ncbi:MAG: N-acetylglucosamine-6-phosphate deacetylase [Clostridia bacterium]|nr:N-acetylglucosamine-6-phosphate deacetylase [Clostridia bacterium]
MTAIVNAKILTPYRVVEGCLVMENGKIKAITQEVPDECEIIDAQGHYVSPGFIDLHTHGGGGHDYMDGTVEAFEGAAKAHLEHGTTALLVTTLTCSDEELFNAFKVFETVKNSDFKGPELLGLHLEGPYFSESQKGAQDPRYLRNPDPEHYLRIFDACPYIRRMTVAPELPGAMELGAELKRRGILASIGHTDADYEDVLVAREYGYDLLTHFYSGMSTLRRVNAYRHLGVIETGYLLDDMSIEIIADGKHLPPELLRLIVKNKSWDRICLITDSMRGAGMPEGSHPKLGSLKDGQETVISDGVAFLLDKSAFAGSVCTADRCIRTMVQLAGVPLLDAVRMMTVNPARQIGMDDRKGVLRAGMDADVCIFDDDIQIKAVFVAGQKLVDHL